MYYTIEYLFQLKHPWKGNELLKNFHLDSMIMIYIVCRLYKPLKIRAMIMKTFTTTYTEDPFLAVSFIIV